jgi:hypothetical protein
VNVKIAPAWVRKHPAVNGAVREGARIVEMPRLSCMSQVTDRGLTFDEAMKGTVKPGQALLPFFDQVRVSLWWEREVPDFFLEEIPAQWLPEMRRRENPSRGGNEIQEIGGAARRAGDA